MITIHSIPATILLSGLFFLCLIFFFFSLHSGWRKEGLHGSRAGPGDIPGNGDHSNAQSHPPEGKGLGLSVSLCCLMGRQGRARDGRCSSALFMCCCSPMAMKAVPCISKKWKGLASVEGARWGNILYFLLRCQISMTEAAVPCCVWFHGYKTALWGGPKMMFQ